MYLENMTAVKCGLTIYNIYLLCSAICMRICIILLNFRLLTLQLFLAVEHLHRHNIVHRDLKAENILLDKGEMLKLSNFWYATSVNDGELLTGKRSPV